MPTGPATFFIAAILPYVAAIVLIDGLLYRAAFRS